MKTMNDIPVEGWAPLMIVVLVLGGIQMLMMGFIGEYLWRVLAQSRRRDLYLVEESWSETDEDSVAR
jgi:dolichol-phosphate mannosyltransferase